MDLLSPQTEVNALCISFSCFPTDCICIEWFAYDMKSWQEKTISNYFEKMNTSYLVAALQKLLSVLLSKITLCGSFCRYAQSPSVKPTLSEADRGWTGSIMRGSLWKWLQSTQQFCSHMSIVCTSLIFSCFVRLWSQWHLWVYQEYRTEAEEKKVTFRSPVLLCQNWK